jgi:hypothetical protein
MAYTPIPAGTPNWDVPVNAAFTNQDERIEINSQDITNLGSTVSGLGGQVATNTADIATNTADIATNTADIGTNAANIATNTADIDAIEVVNGDQWFEITVNRDNTNALRNGQWTPQNQNLIAWSMDPSQAANTLLLSSGTIIFVGLQIAASVAVNNVVLLVNNAGATLTAGQNLVGLYDAAGNRGGISADQSANWLRSGIKTIPLLATANLTPGVYYVAVLSNGTTPITTVRETNLSVGAINVGLTAATARVAELAGQTTLPATVTPGSRSLGNSSMWIAIS